MLGVPYWKIRELLKNLMWSRDRGARACSPANRRDRENNRHGGYTLTTQTGATFAVEGGIALRAWV